MINEVINCITECCSATNNRVTSFLIAAITDESIHIDALFILLQQDPIDAFLKIQQQVLLTEAVIPRGVVEEEVEEEPQQLDDDVVIAIQEIVLGRSDAAYALLMTAVLEADSYDDSTPNNYC